ncbi:T9SS type A sorting domain-containing protein [Fibrobacter sp.]|uniref:T9SS type A sorting domain-containing protein n=1 Tax=Fibrobacter sp. TaxID=35828 RepID=UPI0025C6CCF1|nr:T9SS type A sorting domain-containing protein [Fibrobacter sp.]MDD7498362.1 T9SS type A sorting domain-containing protein [Fibrobacter sp.]MDY5723489.1 T9SS type A sorting domain-containing protein [Fibrobacter sp.]
MFTLPEIAEWSLYDMNGHKIAESHGSEFLWKQGNRGIYIVKARSKGTSYMRKVAIR